MMTPTNVTEQQVSQEDIIARLSAQAPELAALRSNTIKYPTLRNILSATIRELPGETRLPGIRDLAQCLGVSLVTAQRAVRELTSQGLLCSKPRSGVFVPSRETDLDEAGGAASSAGGTADPAPFAPTANRTPHPFRTVFDFGTDSAAPYQRRMWEDIARLFCQEHPVISPALHFETNAQHGANGKLLDVCERYAWQKYRHENIEATLDLGTFGQGMLPVAPTPDGLLSLYHRTYFLFYNTSFLKKHGLPLPAYRSFAEQTAYFRELAPKLEAIGQNPRTYSIQEPITLLGAGAVEFLRLATEHGPDAPPATPLLVEGIRALIEFCRLCRYSLTVGNDWMQARNDFLTGRAPFFLGYSVDYWEFTQTRQPFGLGIYPTLCCDDSFFLWPRVGAISENSEHPVESVHFLAFLLKDEIQEKFGATGNFGVVHTAQVHPKMDADEPWVQAILSRSVPFHLDSKEKYYAVVNVLGGELWRGLQQNLLAEDVAARALQLARSYLRHRSQAG